MNSVFRAQPTSRPLPPPSVMPATTDSRCSGRPSWYRYGLILLTFSSIALIFFGLTAAFVAAGEDANHHSALYTSDVVKPTRPGANIAVDDPR